MAKKESRLRQYADNISQNINDMRTGLNEAGKDLDRANLAKLARIMGFVMLSAGILYLISTLKKLGVF